MNITNHSSNIPTKKIYEFLATKSHIQTIQVLGFPTSILWFVASKRDVPVMSEKILSAQFVLLIDLLDLLHKQG